MLLLEKGAKMLLLKTEKVNENVEVAYNKEYVVITNNKGGEQSVVLKTETLSRLFQMVLIGNSTKTKNEKKKKEKAKAKPKSKPKTKSKR